MTYPLGGDLYQKATFEGAYAKESGELVEGASYQNGVLIVPIEQFEEGRVIEVRNMLYDEESSVVLPAGYLKDSVKIIKHDCQNDPTLEVVDSRLSVGCDLRDGVIELEYRYEENKTNEFSMEDLEFPEDYRWYVLIDDVPTNEYRVEGKSIVITKPLSPAQKIKVIVTNMVIGI